MAGYSRRPLVEKLGIKPGCRVLLINAPAAYREILGPLPDGVSFLRHPARNADLIHIFVTRRAELEMELPRHRQVMPESGILWISWPKKASGVSTDVTEDLIRELALPLGLVDTKVCAVDNVWSGLKLMIRRRERTSPARKGAGKPERI